MNRPKTIFLDIDGTIIHHCENMVEQITGTHKLLDNAIEKLMEWERKGYNIILTTGRKESYRARTEAMLDKLGVPYDQMVMGIGGGVRVLVNDRKLDNTNDTAIAINLERNEGIGKIEI